jgi:hypothetical protein
MMPFTLRRRSEGLGLSLILSTFFLGGCVWLVYRELEAILGASKITGSISWVSDFNAILATRLAIFTLGVLAVHGTFALAVWGLARLSRAALHTHVAGSMSVHVIAWALVLAFVALTTNAHLYPASRFAFADFGLPAKWNGYAMPVLLLLAMGTLAVAVAVAAYLRGARLGAPARGLLGAIAIIAAAGFVAQLLAGVPSEARVASGPPNIVILGLDSMRSDMSEVVSGPSLTPTVDDFLAGSHHFVDTVSPLARTFPAWVSILTGRHPVTTNARFNLMPRSLIYEGDTLADAVRTLGYRSVFATDEVRFANLDASYGFDELITPPVGASDFVIGAVGDQPLVNLVAGSRLGAFFFPQIHANRAHAVTYEPEQFVARLDRKLQVSGPSFLSIHLTLAHWPYSRAGQVEPSTPQSWRPAYRQALREVDRQFGDVLALLERKGVLDNAIVVVLSDHGEALGFPSDSMVRNSGTPLEIWDSLWGHGTSVVSPHQYGVVLAMRAYGHARLPGRAGRYDWPVTLEDVRPTLEELVTGRAPEGVDGLSLVPFMAEPERAASLAGRVRFTETCFNTVKMLKGKITKSGVVSEAGIYYEMDPSSGWVQLRADRLPEILARKQRAAISREALLAVIPGWTDGDGVMTLYSDRRSPAPRRLGGRPDPATDPEAARLWQALEARFPGELPGAPAGP